MQQQFPTQERAPRRALLVSKGWLQAAVLIFLCGFFVMGLLAYATYTDEPPIPAKVVDPNGHVIFTGADIINGQGVFLRNGLMEYGSIFGHGAYLGPDYTADYLHRAALYVQRRYGGPTSDMAVLRTIREFQANTYNRSTQTLHYTAAQAQAFDQLRQYYQQFFSNPTTIYGLRPHAITDLQQIKQLTAFFSWSAWAASARRPGQNYSYTNNWPPEALVGNSPTANTVVWSVLSLITLLGGIGVLLAVYGRWNFLGWHGRERATLSFRPPGEVPLTPSQRACAWFLLVMAALFLVQTLVGAASEHYRADITNFFGIDLAQLLPYNLVRTWHVQLAIFWVATSFLASGIFLVPMIGGREPRGQNWLSYLLLAALFIWATDLVALATLRTGERILDVACGTGAVAREAARVMGADGTVTGLDLNAGMLSIARGHDPEATVQWCEGSAPAMPFPDAVFTLVLCQQGVQYFPDRTAALREMHRVLVSGGRLVLSVWRAIERTPGFLALGQALARRSPGCG